MVLSGLEDLFTAGNMPFQREGDGRITIEVPEGKGVALRIQFAAEQDNNDWILACCYLDTVPNKNIWRFKELQVEITEYFHYRLFAQRLPEGYGVYTYIRPPSAQEEIKDFIWGCRKVTDLLDNAIANKKWDKALIALAFDAAHRV